MSLVDVEVRTVFLTDYAANHDKFYRVYVIGKYCAFQWGRRGTLGQFEVHTYPTASGATLAANTKLNSKLRSGYGNQETAQIRFDLARFTPDANPKSESSRKYGRQLAAVYDASHQSTPGPRPSTGTTPTAEAEPTQALKTFTSDALAAITLAVGDPVAAMVQYAKLNERWAAVEEEVEIDLAKARSYLDTLDSLVAAQ